MSLLIYIIYDKFRSYQDKFCDYWNYVREKGIVYSASAYPAVLCDTVQVKIHLKWLLLDMSHPSCFERRFEPSMQSGA